MMHNILLFIFIIYNYLASLLVRRYPQCWSVCLILGLTEKSLYLAFFALIILISRFRNRLCGPAVCFHRFIWRSSSAPRSPRKKSQYHWTQPYGCASLIQSLDSQNSNVVPTITPYVLMPLSYLSHSLTRCDSGIPFHHDLGYFKCSFLYFLPVTVDEIGRQYVPPKLPALNISSGLRLGRNSGKSLNTNSLALFLVGILL